MIAFCQSVFNKDYDDMLLGGIYGKWHLDQIWEWHFELYIAITASKGTMSAPYVYRHVISSTRWLSIRLQPFQLAHCTLPCIKFIISAFLTHDNQKILTKGRGHAQFLSKLK